LYQDAIINLVCIEVASNDEDENLEPSPSQEDVEIYMAAGSGKKVRTVAFGASKQTGNRRRRI
jgi:hypothetical protein